MGAPDTASFTIPCLGYLLCGYHIIAEDTEKHQWLMVTGHSRKYLWVLARAPGLEDAKFAAIKKQARDWGYDADGMVIHNDPVPLPKILPPVPQMRPNVRRGAEVPVMPGTEPPSRMEPKSPELLPMDEPPSMPPEGPPPMPAEGPPPMPPNPPPMPPNPPPMPSFVPEPMGPIYLQPNSEGSENPEP